MTDNTKTLLERLKNSTTREEKKELLIEAIDSIDFDVPINQSVLDYMRSVPLLVELLTEIDGENEKVMDSLEPITKEELDNFFIRHSQS